MNESAKGSGYSLWIMPGPDDKKRYEDIISSLSSKYSTPHFEPHVTLLGGLTGQEEILIRSASKVAMKMFAFKIRFTTINCLNEYFRSLFVLVEKTKEIEDAWNIAFIEFGLKPSEYMPHMSLFYGTIAEEIKRDEIKKLEAEHGVGEGFFARKLALYSTEGNVERWHEVGSFDLAPAMQKQ